MGMKVIMRMCSLLFMPAFLLSLFVTGVLAVEPYNLWVSGLYADRKDVAPGDTVNVTYQLRANADLFGNLKMEIFVRSGPNGAREPAWTIQDFEGNGMGSGRTLTKTRQITIPDWGDGTYFISISANVDRFLGESSFGDNFMEIPLRVAKTKSTIPPMDHLITGYFGKYPYDKQCGDNTLSVVLNRDRVRPGANLTITASWIKQVETVPKTRVEMTIDGGQFATGKLRFTGVTRQDGSIDTQWQAPTYPDEGSGEVRHTLNVTVRTKDSDGQSSACINQIPLLVKW
jgi:hypothetical protein